MIPPELFDAFRGTLLAGGYNLLVGSGISLDSQNGRGELLRSSEQLRLDLCALKNVANDTTLARVYRQLTEPERDKEIVDRFSKCRPGPSLLSLPQFLWKQIFTFNIDDVLEAVFDSPDAKQRLEPIHYKDQYKTSERSTLLAVHLHGWVAQPTRGFVFTHSEYAQVMSGPNPWMHTLSELLATEPFIIAGTSLNEVDLEYYLSFRNPITQRHGRGPSLLIEPAPDAVTKLDCERHGLLLVKAEFGDFLAWLHRQFPTPPTLFDLVVPDATTVFPQPQVSKQQMLRFFSTFRFVEAGDQKRTRHPSEFLYGREPQDSDLRQHIDIERQDTEVILNDVEEMLSQVGDDNPRMLVVLDEAGTGKTTVIRRVGHDLTNRGQPVLMNTTLSKIDVTNTAKCLAASTRPVLLLIDGLADHAEQVAALLRDHRCKNHFVVLASERSYREEFLDIALENSLRRVGALKPLSVTERLRLIELYREFGVLGDKQAINKPSEFAAKLKHDHIAIAVCRILNDFKPLETIIKSLWRHTEDTNRLPFVCVALARHCHVAGIHHGILQSIVGRHTSIASLFANTVALRITEHSEHDDYLLPVNAVIGEGILIYVAGHEPDLIFDAFQRMAIALAPHVNRDAIRERSPEARLAGRLFDADKIVVPMLGKKAEDFYVSCHSEWSWDSRYWEQRALLIADSDLETALHYIKHALAINRNPFPLTTLGKLLLKQMQNDSHSREAAFDEALDALEQAIDLEGAWSRITIHPFLTLIMGTTRYLELGETLTDRQRAVVERRMGDAVRYFRSHPMLRHGLGRLDALLRHGG